MYDFITLFYATSYDKHVEEVVIFSNVNKSSNRY